MALTRPDPPGVSLVTLDAVHVPEAAALIADRVRALSETVPPLPTAWSEGAALTRLISELVVRGAGMAALADGRLVGFQAATLVDGHGGRWAYTPDFGHAATGQQPGRIVEALYARLAADWARQACLEHVVTVLEHDREAMATLVRLGFGQSVLDLVRDLSAVPGALAPPGVEVRRAGPADTAAIIDLDRALREHLAASPVFLRSSPARSPELHRRDLADEGVATFLAESAGRVIAMLRIGPSATDVATIVRDPGTASITAAYTAPDRRGSGVAGCLLDAAVRWARDRGYVRAAVDHESANGEAFRFWARHFSVVAVSMTRRLPAHAAGPPAS